ncbi:MAG: OFA family MFS transporter [Spirochaetes bacterium]|nr:OFA family MFS transporter [Spirochaetota bacterium]MBU0955734.1 OFA family MFS transporter [Spirochaetota bacterium]
MFESVKSVRVLLAGTAINVCVGFLFAWSVFKLELVAGWGWSYTAANAPYTVAIIWWAVSLLMAGLLQHKLGPKKLIQAGIALVGIGLMAAGFVASPAAMIFCVGILSATGIGFSYGCITPLAMQWFHSSKKGFVSGLTVGGFGLAAVIYAPLASALISGLGISRSFVILGAGVLLIGLPLSTLLAIPPSGHFPPAPPVSARGKHAPLPCGPEFSWRQMIKTTQFYQLWLMFLLSASAGVMLIGHLAAIATRQAGITNSAIIVSLLAVSNAAGRILGGLFSDKIGRLRLLLLVFTTQLLNMLAFSFYSSFILIVFGTLVAGFSYGALMSAFPAITADTWGMKSYGINYGLMFTAWGLSGVLGPFIAGYTVDLANNYTPAFLLSAVFLGIALLLGMLFNSAKKLLIQQG